LNCKRKNTETRPEKMCCVVCASRNFLLAYPKLKKKNLNANCILLLPWPRTETYEKFSAAADSKQKCSNRRHAEKKGAQDMDLIRSTRVLRALEVGVLFFFFVFPVQYIIKRTCCCLRSWPFHAKKTKQNKGIPMADIERRRPWHNRCCRVPASENSRTLGAIVYYLPE
jgi:hypothetical protein